MDSDTTPISPLQFSLFHSRHMYHNVWCGVFTLRHFSRNAEGCTPFMQAVCNRAYQAAVVVLDVAKKMSSVIKEDRSEVNQEVGFQG